MPFATFSHDEEEAGAGYYEVEFGNMDIEVELTTGKRSGMHEYEFGGDKDRFIILDLFEGATTDKILDVELNILDENSLSGLKRTSGWAKDQYVYFYAEFSEPFSDYTVVEDGQAAEGDSFKGTGNLKCILSFGDAIGEIRVKVGISAVDAEGARENLHADITGWDLEGARQAAFDSWNDVLGRIEVEGGTEARKTIFYTALYHAYLSPYLYSDADGRYRGHDHAIHKTSGHNMYTVFSLWDTFRALHPLFTITQQALTTDLILSMLDMYDKGGLLPMWELAANETWCMIGYHSIPVILDAWVKGIDGFDSSLALEAMKKSSMQDREGLNYYRQYGYIPAGKDGSSVSKTLEYAYDDWCIAQMAKGLNSGGDYSYYTERAQHYKNLFDPETGFMRGRMNGMWVKPFDPTEVNFMLTEANTWQYTFFAPHDISGMMALLGGKEKFAAKLDEMFTAESDLSGRHQSDITGLIGQYAHGNEPSHHMAYLYNFAGQPWKTQDLARKIMDEQYSEHPDGLCGNEDCGQMSAWYVLSAMGFYPVTPGLDYYVTGSPVFDKVTIHLENGNSCVIEARNNSSENKYIQSASLNGKPMTKSFIYHRDIMDGGHFVFEMGPEPEKNWGSADEDIPVAAVQDHPITPAPFLIADSRTFITDLDISMGCLDTNAVIYYTLDGSEPNENSAVYTAPLTISKNTVVRAIAHAEGKISSKIIEGVFSLMPQGRKVVYNTSYNSQYAAGGTIALIDLIRGTDNFQTGSWQGFHGDDVDIIVDLGEEMNLRQISAGFLQDQNSWIFMPEWVEFSISRDGREWETIAREINRVDERYDGGITHDFSVMTSGAKIRYIKILGKNRAICPEWHPGAGSPAWLFIDEIVIE